MSNIEEKREDVKEKDTLKNLKKISAIMSDIDAIKDKIKQVKSKSHSIAKKISTKEDLNLAVMNMLKILSSLMIATLTVGCGGREKEKETRQDTERVEQVCPVPKYKYMDMTELGRLCNSDSVHYKSLMFVSPYCGGTIHRFRERINPAMATMDTTDWKFYYIVEVDLEVVVLLLN